MLIIQYWIFKNLYLCTRLLYGKARKSEIENEKVQAV